MDEKKLKIEIYKNMKFISKNTIPKNGTALSGIEYKKKEYRKSLVNIK